MDVLHKGISISEINCDKPINFNILKNNNIEIVIIKTTEGSNKIDSKLNENYTNCINSKIKIGFYHKFIQKDNIDLQIKNFIKSLKNKKCDCKLIIELDDSYEVNNKNNRQLILFINGVKKESNINCIIKSNKNIIEKLKYNEEFNNIGFWSTGNVLSQNVFWEWNECLTYKKNIRLNGITGLIDLNKFKDSIYIENQLTRKTFSNNQEKLLSKTQTRNILHIQKHTNTINCTIGTNNPKYIVLHYVGAQGSTAYNNCVYFAGGDRGTSAHYFVDDTSMWQCIEDNNSAWHVGNTRTEVNNNNSIGIEMCCMGANLGVTDATEANALELTRFLMDKYNIPVSNVRTHYEVSGNSKVCPNWSDNNWSRWTNFKAKLGGSNINPGQDKPSDGGGGTYPSPGDGHISKTPEQRIDIEELLGDIKPKYDLTSRVHDMQTDPTYFNDYHFKQDYVIFIRKKKYYASTALKGEEAYERIYQVDSFMSASTSASCTEAAAGSCNVTILGNTRIICADKSGVDNAGWDSYEELINQWKYDIDDLDTIMEDNGDYHMYSNLIFDNISDMKKVKYGYRIAEKCDFDPMDEIHIYGKSRHQKDSDGKYKVHKIFFGYITDVTKAYNNKSVPTISIKAEDHLKLLKISYIASTMSVNYITAIAGSHYDRDFADNIIIDDNVLAGPEDPEIGYDNFFDNIFAGRYAHEIIERCCREAGIPESYLEKRVEKIKRIPFLPQIRSSLAVELFTSDVRDRLSYCKEAARKIHVEFFADEEGNIVLKIPNYTLGINQMPANNDYIDLSEEDKEKIANGGTVIKEYEKKITETVDVTETIQEAVYHTVQINDTLWDIAYKYLGDGNKWDTIWNLNTGQIADPHWIFPGQVLRIMVGKTVTTQKTITRTEIVKEEVSSETISSITDKYIRKIEDKDLISFVLSDSDSQIINVFKINMEVPLIQAQMNQNPYAVTRVVQDWQSIIKFGMRPPNTINTPLINTEVSAVYFGTMMAMAAQSQRYRAHVTMIEESNIKVGDPIRLFLYDEHPFKFNEGYETYGREQAIFYIERIDRNLKPSDVSTMTLTLGAGRVMGMQSIYDKMYDLYKDYFTEPKSDEVPWAWDDIYTDLGSGVVGPGRNPSSENPGGGSPGDSELNTDNDVARTVYNVLIADGFTPEAACAVLGNMQQESGLRPTVVNSIGATGLCQWLGGRLDGLKQYAASTGGSWEDPAVQAGWVIEELRGADPTTSSLLSQNCGGYLGFKSLTNIDTAVVMFRKCFERCAEWEANDAARISYAKSFYSQIVYNDGGGSNPSNPGQTGGGLGSEAAELAKTYLGVPYVWGGTSPSGFDCSGLVMYVYSKLGVSLPRTTWDQVECGTSVSKSNLQPGDLVFFNCEGEYCSHVGMFVSGDTFIHAPQPGDVVKYSTLSSSYYANCYLTARRVV